MHINQSELELRLICISRVFKCLAQDSFAECPRTAKNLSKYTASRR